jgi:hypothetical protein
MTEQEIRDLFKTKNVPLDAKDVWRVQSALVIKHAALERLAATLGIVFDKPEVLRAEADECVLLVHGRLGEAQEWSIGEAKIGLNYQVSGKQAGYPYAMSEKRAKDRVILKLAKLHGAYSSEEADAFTQAQASQITSAILIAALRMAKSKLELDQWLSRKRQASQSRPPSEGAASPTNVRSRHGSNKPPSSQPEGPQHEPTSY